jgi:hypothetical protein
LLDSGHGLELYQKRESRWLLAMAKRKDRTIDIDEVVTPENICEASGEMEGNKRNTALMEQFERQLGTSWVPTLVGIA